MKRYHALLLIITILIGSVLRLYSLGNTPSLQEDEADLGYNAYSLLKTGKDSTGTFLPIATTSLGDARPALYIYLIAIPIAILGLTEWAIRLPAAIISIATIYILYLFSSGLFKNKTIGIVSAALLSISYWHITLSREASEKILSLFLVLLGTYFVLKLFQTVQKKYIFLSFLCYFLSMHAYYAPRIFLLFFIPLLFIVFNLSFHKPHLQKTAWIYTAFFLSIAVYFSFFFGGSGERISQLSIFTYPETQAVLQEQLGEDYQETPYIVSRLFHNKPVNYSFTLIRNYFSHFTPEFLYISGGISPRYRVPSIGLSNIFELPFLLAGVYVLGREIIERKKLLYTILFIWLLVAIIPSAFAFHEVPSSYRSLMAIPPFIMINAAGLIAIVTYVHKLKKGHILLFLFTVAYVWHFLYFIHQYFVHFEIHQPWYRNYAMKELALYLQQNQNKYDHVYITQNSLGTNHVIPFYLQYDPILYQQNWKNGKHFQDLGNIKFADISCPYPLLVTQQKVIEKGKYLFINHAECERESKGAAETTILWKDTTPAFYSIPFTIR